MSYESSRIAIDTYIKNGFHGYTIIPENFDPPTAAGIAWVRYSIRPVSSESADVGGTFRRRIVNLWFQIFVPEDKGTVDATKIGDLLATLFDEVALNTTDGLIRFRRASLEYFGPDLTGWQLWRCIVPFQEDYGA